MTLDYLRHLCGLLRGLPPRAIAVKALGSATRRLGASKRKRADQSLGSHSSSDFSGIARLRPVRVCREKSADVCASLAVIGRDILAHRFDLLGSGPVEVRYGVQCRGFLGCVYPAASGVTVDPAGHWLKGIVNGSNRAEAQRLWSLIADEAYRPIDWQIDFRSGYRWAGDTHVYDLAIPIDTGADVKVPWELGRLQHFPQLALCAALAAQGVAGFEPPGAYRAEIRSQFLDFMALNPPRFGVQWMSPMEAGIRIANMLLAVDLLEGLGLGLDAPVMSAVVRSAEDHAAHIVSHLEWSEGGRSNHYLADLFGLLWASAHLPENAASNAWLAFAATELQREAARQFLPDGGNYEGSTHYHRLSSELLLFALALLRRLETDDSTLMARISSAGLSVRPPIESRPPTVYRHENGVHSVLCPGVIATLGGAADLTRAITRPDRHIVQIGDTDSGCVFKIQPVGQMSGYPEKLVFREDTLEPGWFPGAVAAFLGEAKPASIDGELVVELARGTVTPAAAAVAAIDHGDLDAVVWEIQTLPSECRRHRVIWLPASTLTRRWERHAFPLFGVYVFRSPEDFIAFRCAPPPPPGSPFGHRHDDNLGLEYVLGGKRFIDPGSFVYTPSSALRNKYRAAGAHDVPRAEAWDVAPPGSMLFELSQAAWAECLAWSPRGVAGRISAAHGQLLRAIVIGEMQVDIWDGVNEGRLRALSESLPVAIGYGQTEDPVPPV